MSLGFWCGMGVSDLGVEVVGAGSRWFGGAGWW